MEFRILLFSYRERLTDTPRVVTPWTTIVVKMQCLQNQIKSNHLKINVFHLGVFTDCLGVFTDCVARCQFIEKELMEELRAVSPPPEKKKRKSYSAFLPVKC